MSALPPFCNCPRHSRLASGSSGTSSGGRFHFEHGRRQSSSQRTNTSSFGWRQDAPSQAGVPRTRACTAAPGSRWGSPLAAGGKGRPNIAAAASPSCPAGKSSCWTALPVCRQGSPPHPERLRVKQGNRDSTRDPPQAARREVFSTQETHTVQAHPSTSESPCCLHRERPPGWAGVVR